MITVLITIGSVCTALIACVSFLVLVVKPIRRQLVRWIKGVSQSNEIGERLNEITDMLEKHLTTADKNQKLTQAQLNATRSILRNTITHMYYKYLPRKGMPVYEQENLIKLYDAYHNLDGNSYIDTIYAEMMEWDVYFTDVIQGAKNV